MKAKLILALAVALTTANLGLADELSPRDQRKAAVQKICPVSGNALGDHGEPIKVRVGDEEVFLCCQGCVEGEIKPEHWATIHANFARAQKICPVMKQKLPKDPEWTIVEGQIFYLCCPPCSEKIQANSEAYLAKLDELYADSLKPAKRPSTNSDRR